MLVVVLQQVRAQRLAGRGLGLGAVQVLPHLHDSPFEISERIDAALAQLDSAGYIRVKGPELVLWVMRSVGG